MTLIDSTPELYVIDEGLGPESWNIQLVCAEIIRMRGDLTHDEFMIMCCQIADKVREDVDIPQHPMQLNDDEKARIRDDLITAARARRDGDQE